jgi:hypothetical protein
MEAVSSCRVWKTLETFLPAVKLFQMEEFYIPKAEKSYLASMPNTRGCRAPLHVISEVEAVSTVAAVSGLSNGIPLIDG